LAATISPASARRRRAQLRRRAQSTTPYIMAVACWRADREAEAWRQFCALVAEFTGRAPDREPPDLAWLGVYVLPYAPALLPRR